MSACVNGGNLSLPKKSQNMLYTLWSSNTFQGRGLDDICGTTGGGAGRSRFGARFAAPPRLGGVLEVSWRRLGAILGVKKARELRQIGTTIDAFCEKGYFQIRLCLLRKNNGFEWSGAASWEPKSTKQQAKGKKHVLRRLGAS